MVILAIFPSTYKVVEIPLCGQEAYLSIEIENVLVKEVDENMDYTGYEKWDQETNIYCVGDGNKREVSTQGWLYLTAFSSILLPLVLLIGMVLNVSLGFIKKMIFKKN